MDRKLFYDKIRAHVNLTTENVFGMEKLLDYAERFYGHLTAQWLAYIIATAWWESAQTMHPVKEAYWLSEDWRKKNLRYYPWYGRGLIQTTWEVNYQNIAKAIGLPANFFTKDPDMLLMFEYALPALFVGMEKGVYTGKDLDDYMDLVDETDAEDLREYKQARRIVNGTDKADAIGKLALMFENALKDSGWSASGATPMPPLPTPEPIPAPTPEPVEPEPEKPWWVKLLDFFFGGKDA